MGKKAKTPAAPDYTALNEQQAALNKGAAYDVMGQNRYTQQAATGSSNEWITDPVTGKVTNKTSFGPSEQPIYDQNAALRQKYGQLGNAAADQFGQNYYGGAPGGGGMIGSFSGGGAGGGGGYFSGGSGGGGGGGGSYSSSPGTSSVPGGIYASDPITGTGGVGGDVQRDLDYSKLTAMPGDTMAERQQVQDALYKRQTGYLDPQYQESQRSLETQLSNKGLVPGTPAFNNAMQVLNQAKEKA